MTVSQPFNIVPKSFHSISNYSCRDSASVLQVDTLSIITGIKGTYYIVGISLCCSLVSFILKMSYFGNCIESILFKETCNFVKWALLLKYISILSVLILTMCCEICVRRRCAPGEYFPVFCFVSMF